MLNKWIVTLTISFFSSLTMANINVGDVPPSYLGKSREGNQIELSEMTGKVVVATFWATWCPPCMKEMPFLDKVQKQIGKDKLEIVGINFKQDKKLFRKFTSDLKDVDLTLTFDHKGKVSDRYGVNAVPHMLIIGKDGRVAHIHQGYSEASLPTIIKELNALLAEKENNESAEGI